MPKRLVAHGCSYEADQVCIMLIILKLKVAKYHNNNNHYYYFISGAKKAHRGDRGLLSIFLIIMQARDFFRRDVIM